MNEIYIQVEADVNPTENQNKVKTAMENIFGNLEFELTPQGKSELLVAKIKGSSGLAKFGELLRRERIRNAARRVLLESVQGKGLTFYMNKQVAFVGHVSFSNPTGESPLGPIKVQIRCDNPTELIDWLAPRTAHKH